VTIDCIVQPTVSQGEIKTTGLSVAGRVTEVALNAVTWTALPPTPLDGRNAISIQNLSGTQIKINYDPTIATYTGVVMNNEAERFYDITDSIIIYAKAQAGTPTITIEELS
jgi:hypothetical protein